MNILYIKALHIIFVVTWFAGLFYIVRLFIYDVETKDKPENERNILSAQFRIMQKRLWYGITWPSAILTWFFGLWLVYSNPDFLKMPWFHIKLTAVVLLTIYHLSCGMILKQLKNEQCNYSTGQLRIWNEVATVFLVSIIFLVELQHTLNWIYGLIGLFGFTAILMIAIKFYKKFREK
ncbi:MAG TPA: CopD family protein [Bacteroidia bacterium]|nr:CopD family protein [Bacteroidia bacterium]